MKHVWIALLSGTSLLFGQSSTGMIISGGYQYTWPREFYVAPGQVLVLAVQGMSNRLKGTSYSTIVNANALPLPTVIEGISVKVYWKGSSYDAPLFRVSVEPSAPDWEDSTPITTIALQVPFALNPSHIGPPFPGFMEVFEDGVAKARIPVYPDWSKPHIIKNYSVIGFLLPPHIGVRHMDSTPVTRERPAKPGEILTLYAVGLGLSPSQILLPFRAGEPSTEGIDAAVAISFEFGFNPKAGPVPDYPWQRGELPPPQEELISARFLSGKVGVYEVKFRVPEVPPGTPACGGLPLAWQHNLMVNIGFINWFSPWGNRQDYDGIGICVEVPSSE